MYTAQQEAITKLEDALDIVYDKDGWVKWHTHRVVNVSVRPSLVSVRPYQLDKPLVRPTSIRVTTR